MDGPAARFVTTADGKSIAYGVTGKGRPLVFGPIPFSHVQLTWAEHSASGIVRALADHFRLIHFDPRGLGMSTRGLGASHRLQDWLLDLEAVVKAENLSRFVLMASGGFGGDVAVRYAVSNPDRVVALVLSGYAPMPEQNIRSLYESAVSRDFDLFLSLMLDQSQTAEYRLKQLDNLKQIITKEDHLALARVVQESGGSEDLLPKLTVPTLVIQPRDFRLTSQDEAARAARLAHGRLIVNDGMTGYGDPDQAVRAIEGLLAELPETTWNRPSVATTLSPREIEVLRLLAAGRSNQQIADELVISLNTVQRHVGSILTKTDLANRTEAAAYALRNGLA